MQTSAPEPVPVVPDEAPAAPAPADPSPNVIESASAILGLEDRPSELVLIPEWKGAVYVRALSASDRDTLEAETLEASKNGDPTKVKIRYQDFRARLAVRSIVTRSGARLFTDADWQQLASKSAAALDRICSVAVALSRMGQQDLERLMGESVAAQPSASPTA